MPGSPRLGFAAALLSALLAAQEDPGVKAQRGKQAMAEGRFADAARIYSELTREIPGTRFHSWAKKTGRVQGAVLSHTGGSSRIGTEGN